ncbi:hypothetical protein LCGC14_1087930 [marine sediment metagenome]|uniref:Uncharacterized protein n=1 Tax=marine sediment metagenome TaxID=412755 RepID=A0A0F9MHQ1_9ZZZZ
MALTKEELREMRSNSKETDIHITHKEVYVSTLPKNVSIVTVAAGLY